MGIVTGLTKERMLEIEANSIVEARKDGADLILTTRGGVETNVGSVVGTTGAFGADAILLRVASSRGTSFKNNAISTILTVTIFRGTERITALQQLQEAFGYGVYLEWWWRRTTDITFNLVSSADNRLSQSGFSFTVSPDDVDQQTVFECRLQF